MFSVICELSPYMYHTFIFVSMFLPKVSRRIFRLYHGTMCVKPKVNEVAVKHVSRLVLRVFLGSIMIPILRNHLHRTIILIKEHTERSLETCKHESCFRYGWAVWEEMLWLWCVVVLKSLRALCQLRRMGGLSDSSWAIW